MKGQAVNPKSSTNATSSIPTSQSSYTSTGFNKNVAGYFSEEKYAKKKITIPESEPCRLNGNCTENLYEEGYIRVADGVFYFPYSSDLNGNPYGKGSGTEGVNKIFNDRLERFFAAAKEAGYTLRIKPGVGDGYRDIDTQKYYKCCQTYGSQYNNSTRTSDGRFCSSDKSKDGCGSRNSASDPGTSPHGWGVAADLDLWKTGSQSKNKDAVKWAHQNAVRFGLTFPVSNEDWHIEPLYVCDINGKSGKYGECKRQTMYYCPGDSTNPSGASVHTCSCGSC